MITCLKVGSMYRVYNRRTGKAYIGELVKILRCPYKGNTVGVVDTGEYKINIGVSKGIWEEL